MDTTFYCMNALDCIISLLNVINLTCNLLVKTRYKELIKIYILIQLKMTLISLKNQVSLCYFINTNIIVHLNKYST